MYSHCTKTAKSARMHFRRLFSKTLAPEVFVFCFLSLIPSPFGELMAVEIGTCLLTFPPFQVPCRGFRSEVFLFISSPRLEEGAEDESQIYKRSSQTLYAEIDIKPASYSNSSHASDAEEEADGC